MTTTTAPAAITAHAWATLTLSGFAGMYLVHRDARFGAVSCGCENHRTGTAAMACAAARARSYGYTVVSGWHDGFTP